MLKSSKHIYFSEIFFLKENKEIDGIYHFWNGILKIIIIHQTCVEEAKVLQHFALCMAFNF
jgi:hypothetical protein